MVNIDWPVWSGPDLLYEGFSIYEPMRVDPLLGTDADWSTFVDAAHARGMRVVCDFNPSYFSVNAPAFLRAVDDVRSHGIGSLPVGSTARWFRWNATCPKAPEQPTDSTQCDGMTDGWVHSSAAGACYFAVWGGKGCGVGGNPTSDFAATEWRAQLTKILTHWVVDRKVDGFMFDAPPWYLASTDGVHDGRHHRLIAKYIRQVIVEPMHRLGAVIFGEMYNLAQSPTISKMIDGGRNTDLPGVPGSGFPGKLHQMVVHEDATGLEGLLRSTVDIWDGWSGTVRTGPHSAGPAEIAGLKAAATALLAGYYVVRMGPDCESPYGPGYGPSPPGDEWPGGCFGDWNGTAPVASTLKALPKKRALWPGSPRKALAIESGQGSRGAYAALRTSADGGAVVLLNLGSVPVTIRISHDELAGNGIATPQTTTDIIGGGNGPQIGAGTWAVAIPPRGWAAYGVALDLEY